jgi:hypothetical protein
LTGIKFFLGSDRKLTTCIPVHKPTKNERAIKTWPTKPAYIGVLVNMCQVSAVPN